MIEPSREKIIEVQVLFGTMMRSSSWLVAACHTLISSKEHVANNSDVPLYEKLKLIITLKSILPIFKILDNLFNLLIKRNFHGK